MAMNCADSRDAACAYSAVSSLVAVGGIRVPTALADRMIPVMQEKVASSLSNLLWDTFVWLLSLEWNKDGSNRC
jgi:hypothetical protein